uniref:Uncharacterized protein n=1 Tax=Setaria italica TaxID=4555 RepID=K3ZYF2_SETIT
MELEADRAPDWSTSPAKAQPPDQASTDLRKAAAARVSLVLGERGGLAAPARDGKGQQQRATAGSGPRRLMMKPTMTLKIRKEEVHKDELSIEVFIA